MSPHVGNFVQDLVEMAKAMDELPKVQEALTNTQGELKSTYDIIQRIELKLIDRNSEIDTLKAKIRELEVSRDDAEFRFLECDDVKGSLVRTLEGLGKDIAGVLMAIAPVAILEPQVEVKEVAPDPIHQQELTAVTHMDQQSFSVNPTVSRMESVPFGGTTNEVGQSVPVPIVQVTSVETGENVQSIGALDTENVSQNPTMNSFKDDIEPTKHNPDGLIRQEWWDWSDRKWQRSSVA